ncbi:hypothetical protein [Klebsiella quasipneumoniae]|uniref:hypothetical protein n=1 Tax=Klebsiella quasipneumoniae TaxID=1463165 RepID=UPI002B051C53|nr:hypothetical protein [Klebsiella quasipneumoniae]
MRLYIAGVAIERSQAQTRRIRQVRYRPSRLDRYTGELLSLYQAGASAAELQRWLRARRIKVVLSTVTRWLEKNG